MKILIIILFMAVICEAQTVQATATWTPSDDVVRYHIFVWEGADVADNPLAEDSSFAFVNSLGLLHLSSDSTQISFQVVADGQFIQVAGFNEYEGAVGAGAIYMPATLSVIVKKINYEKMQDLILLFDGELWHSYVLDSLFLDIRNPDGSLTKRSDGTYNHLMQINGKLQPVVKYKPRTTGGKQYTVIELYSHN